MKKTVRDMDLKNKRVLIRCDYNVPIKDGVILDDNKITASLETLNYLIEQDCKIIILSHLGKVKSNEDKKKNTLEPVAKRLKELLNTRVVFSKQCVSTALEEVVMKMNSKDVLLLENTRHQDYPEKLESGNDVRLANFWAGLADVFVMDAFGSAHRRHASTYGVAKLLPNCIGFLVEKELNNLDKYVMNPERPFTVLMGGAKMDDKLEIIEKLIPNCDNLLLTGCLANTCLRILGFNTGNSVISTDPTILKKTKEILINNREKILLPLDVIVTREYNDKYIKHLNLVDIEADDIIYDIGFKTIDKYKESINNAKTIFVNGTAGKYEDDRFATGTRELLDYIGETNAIKVAGGGDGVSAINKFNLGNKFTYLSTGGGATLEYIRDGKLQALDAIEEDGEYEVLDL